MKAMLAALALLISTPSYSQSAAEFYDQGVAARLAGDHARAETLLRQAVDAEPDNADAHLQLGLALLALDRLDEAEQMFRRTLALAPDYDDARIGLARVYQRRGDTRQAIAELDLVQSAGPEARALRRQLAVARQHTRWRIDFDASHSDLGAGRPNWSEASLALAYRTSRFTTLSGRLEASRRFGLGDVYGEASLNHQFSDGLGGYVLVGATADADFRPRWQVGVGGSARIVAGSNPTVATLDVRQARYRAGDIQTVNPGLEQYVAGGRAWLTARWINIFDEDGGHHSGWLLRGDALADSDVRLFAGVSDAPDVSEGVVTDTFTLFGGLSYDVGDTITLRASIADEDRDGPGDRRQFALGAGFKF